MNKLRKVNGELDEPLAPEGIEQAHSFVSRVPPNVTRIYTSPLRRAVQTAEVIGLALHLPVSVQSELAEIRMGTLAGRSWEEMEDGLRLKHEHRKGTFDYRPFGGESVDGVIDRLMAFIGAVNQKHQDHETLLVTHGGIIRLLNLLEQGQPTYETEDHVRLLSIDLQRIMQNYSRFV